jgi:hypothetical protein
MIQRQGVVACIAVVSALVVSGCASLYQRDIQYDLDDVTRLGGGPLHQQTLVIRELADKRPAEVVSRRGSYDNAAIVKREGDDWYFNSDDHYRTRPVTTAITRMLVEHVGAADLFEKVGMEGEMGRSDLILEGAIECFEAYRDREVGKQALVSQMGLIGMAIAATNKSPYEARVVLSDLRLVRRKDGVVLWQGRVEKATKGEEPISMSSLEVYRHANDALKGAVELLLNDLSRVTLPPDAPLAGTRHDVFP